MRIIDYEELQLTIQTTGTGRFVRAATIAAAAVTLTLADHVPSGPAVGAAIPTLEVSDLNGVKQTLASLSGPKGLMLVFFRSADW